ncbi:MAG: AAA family ATPase [Desulfurococcaceae archaeon]
MQDLHRKAEELAERLNLFRKELRKPFVGREEEADVLTLALMVAENVILIGEPGTAKSALARRAADLLNARFFKYLLTKFTEPDELFGPLDINALKEGKYVRITRNKLPEAEIVFIDEIFNASSAVLNMFLTLMNERIIYDGYNEIKVPLWTLISASNNVPDEPEYQAIYDRFLIRHFVKPVGEDKWGELVDAVWRIEKGVYQAAKPVLSLEELKVINSLIFEVDLSSVKQKLLKLYAIMEDQGVHLTDRRKGKALKLIAAQAFLNNRLKAIEEDLMVLKYVAPRDRDELDKVYAILIEEIEAREKRLRELEEIEENIKEVKAYLLSTTELDPRLLEYLKGLEIARDKIRKMVKELSDDIVRNRAINVLTEIEHIIELIKRKLIL